MRRFARDASWTGFSQLAVALALVLVQVVTTRRTTLAAYGAYATAAAAAAVLEALLVPRSGDMALQFVGRFLASGQVAYARAAAHRIIRRDMLLFGAAFLMVGVLAWPVARFLHTEAWLIAACALTIPAQIGYGPSKAVLLSRSRLRDLAFLDLAYAVEYALLGTAGVVLAGLAGLVAAMALCSASKTLIAKWLAGRQWPTGAEASEMQESMDAVDAEPWLASEQHAIMRNGLLYGAAQADLLILSAFGSREGVAVYRVAKTLAGLPARVAGPIWAALRPRLLHAWHAGDAAAVRRVVIIPAALFLGLGAAALPVAWLAAPWLVQRLYGAAYFAAAVPFLVLLVGTWLQGAVTAWFGFWVVLAERRRTGTAVAGLILAATLVASLLAGRGSALSMATAISAVLVMTSIVCWLIFASALGRLAPQPRE